MTVAGDRAPFMPKGRISLVAACEQILAELQPGQHVMTAVAVDQVGELTGVEWTERAVIGSMRLASEALLERGEAGARTVERFGWVRMTDDDMVDHAEERGRRAYRQVQRSTTAARAADPEKLTGDRRLWRDARLRTQDQLAALLARRAARRRPLR